MDFLRGMGSPLLLFLVSGLLFILGIVGLYRGGPWIIPVILGCLGMGLASLIRFAGKTPVIPPPPVLPDPLPWPDSGDDSQFAEDSGEASEINNEGEEAKETQFEEDGGDDSQSDSSNIQPGHALREFTWRYAPAWAPVPTEDESASVQISLAHLAHFRARQRYYIPPWENFLEYPRTVTRDVHQLASTLRKLSSERQLYSVEEITNVACFVQQAIPYSYDRDSAPNHEEEYPRYPIETLYDKTGDCECKSFLLAALLLVLGYRIAIIILEGHAALGVGLNTDLPGSYYVGSSGEKYYYLETTAEGWILGQIPFDYQQQTPLAFMPLSPNEIARR